MNIIICFVLCGLVLFLGIREIVMRKRDDVENKRFQKFIEHVPNPFFNTQLSKDFWIVPEPLTRTFMEEFELHNYDKQWLKDYVKARNELITASNQ